jgi:hypothetical protein
VQDNLIKSQDGFFTYVRPRIDAIDEVTVSTATPGAESAAEGAVQIKFITRSGTNDLRGSLYWYHREPTLSANYWFQNLQPADPRTGKAPRLRVLLNQFGGRVGGPIMIPKVFDGRNKAFFFVNYEEYHLPEQHDRSGQSARDHGAAELPAVQLRGHQSTESQVPDRAAGLQHHEESSHRKHLELPAVPQPD